MTAENHDKEITKQLSATFCFAPTALLCLDSYFQKWPENLPFYLCQLALQGAALLLGPLA